MKRILLIAVTGILAGCGPKQSDTAVKPNNTSHDVAGPISETKLGVKIYPGARIVTSGETAEIVSANLETADSSDKVATFYQGQLGLAADPASKRVSGTKGGRKFAISIVPSGGGTAVSIMGKK
ncbi:MAG: hypothetical protein ABIP20_01655 [Chthoniobacteraceae bacterium]